MTVQSATYRDGLSEMALAGSLSQPRSPRCKQNSYTGQSPGDKAPRSGGAEKPRGEMDGPVLFTLSTLAHCP